MTRSDPTNSFPSGCADQRFVGDGLFFVATALPTSPSPSPVPAGVASPELAASGGPGWTLPLAVLAGGLVVAGAGLRAGSRVRVIDGRPPLRRSGERR
ncbi:hypothetical protein [Microbacterium sp. 18062]|uniref:hypothetical protein n=1 Tax=Microbacterium sp. 18062 TaxID=2681410 RepID=UPI0035A09662